MVQTPEIGDKIKYHSQEVMEPNPAPGIVDAVYEGDRIDCTITLADETTRQEFDVPPPPQPNEDYYRYWSPKGG